MTARTLLWLFCCCSAGCRIIAEPKHEFEVDPSSLSFNGRAGGLDPPSQNVTISEVDVRPVGWTASVDVAWLRLSSGGDTLPYFLGVEVNTAGLAVGSYGATLVVRRSKDGQEALIPVTLRLQPVVSLDGRWAGTVDRVAVSLNVRDQGGSVSGSGSLSNPWRIVAVAGTYTPPNISLSLVSSAGNSTRLTGSFASDNTIGAIVNGGSLTNRSVTLYRQ